MRRDLRVFAAVFAAALGITPAWAQKHGGSLKLYTLDSPASMSILEETTVFAQRPVMGVFNHLVMFDQQVKQNSLQSIVPDLASGWSWNDDGTELTFPLHEDATWHDGKPFTAKDVQCTWDLLTGKSSEKLRINPRKAWYRNLDRVTANGDYEASSTSSDRNRRFSCCSPAGSRRSIPVTYRRRRCGSIRSAPVRSNSSSSNRTNRSK